MKVVILAGGYGSRLGDITSVVPKPMVEIGGKPILWHIMKIYSYYGFNEFIICCGYKGYMIKEYFADYYLHRSDVTFDFTNKNEMIVHNNLAEPWRVTLIDTGLDTMTGGRLKRVRKYIGNESFMLTYGDGVCDVNIKELVKFHESKGGVATLTAIQPGGRFGVIDIDNTNSIKTFAEKSKEDGGWINGGYMVVEPEIFEYLEGDNTFLEREPLERLARENKLSAYKHDGFWQCMDTQRDKEMLEKLWKENKAKWKVWN